MAKPKMYGFKTVFNPNQQRDLRYRKKTDPRPREKRNPVAGCVATKETEAKE